MNCAHNCAGCAGCGKLGAYTQAPPLAFAGWRLRVGGNPPGGQYHGYLGAAPRWAGASPWDFFNPGHTSAADGVYRSPGETPPSANPNRETNTVVVPHTRRRAGYSVVPGAFSNLGLVMAPIAPIRLPIYPSPKPPVQPFRVDGGFPAPKPPIPGIHTNYILTGATSAVPQTPPTDSPAPAPTVPMNCPPAGTYRDA